jgi:hypothetical protein
MATNVAILIIYFRLNKAKKTFLVLLKIVTYKQGSERIAH